MKKMIKINGKMIELTFEELLNAMNGLLYSWCKKRAGKYFKQNTEDVLQIAKLKLWQCYEKYDYNSGIDIILFSYRAIGKQLNSWRKKAKVIYDSECYDNILGDDIYAVEETENLDINIDLQNILSKKELAHLDAILHNISIQQYCRQENLQYQKTIKEINEMKGKVENYVKTRK